MNCCGKNRKKFARPPEHRTEYGGGSTVAYPPRPVRTVVMEYLGTGGIIVRGPITRNLYHFARTGIRVAVDRRDAMLIAVLSGLRRVN